jgi:putative hemolysin
MSVFIVMSLLLLFASTTFTSLAELSISSVNPLRLKSLADSGSGAAAIVIRIRQRPDVLFGALLVANTVVNVIIPVLVLRLVIDIFEGMDTGSVDTIAVAFSSFVITILEVFAKTLGTARSEKMALLTAYPVFITIAILFPLIRLFNFISNSMNRAIGVNPGFEDDAATLDDVRLAIKSAAEKGYVNGEEEKMMRKLSHLGELSANDIMIPRAEITAFPKSLSCSEASRKIITLPYSRYPVYGDSYDDIEGILHSRDLLACNEMDTMVILYDILYPAFFVPETAPVRDVLESMRRNRTHMLIVVDEYGQTVGLVTLEDVIEEIVGDISDDFDAENLDVAVAQDGSILARARVSLRSLKDEHGIELVSKARSIGGLILQALGSLPHPGQSVALGRYTLTVVSMHGRKIDKVLIRSEGQGQPQNPAPTAPVSV